MTHTIFTHSRVLLITLIPLLASHSGYANEVAEPPAFAAPMPSAALMIKRQVLAEKNQKTVKEAAEVVSETERALQAIEHNDEKRGLTLLRDIAAKLEIILDTYPKAELVSSNIDTDIIEYEGDANSAQKSIDAADDLLDDGNIQAARHILQQLQSEIRVTTTSLPLISFPHAIKEAKVYLSKHKSNEAASAVYDVLNTLVSTTEITPLPVLHAEVLLSEAAELEHKSKLSQASNRNEILKLCTEAREQLKLALTLGYGQKNDYKLLNTALDELEETIHSEQSAATWAKLKQHLAELKAKLTLVRK